MPTLRDKFRGCLLGAMVGDVAGAVVEAESPRYIARRYRSIDEILATESVEEFTGPDWRVGRYTDDTQMMICVAEWLLNDESQFPQRLLARFSEAYEPWRRYGPATAGILRIFRDHKAAWRELSTTTFPHGSYGNGSAMRVAPVGLAYYRDLKKMTTAATESSRPTHSHPLAYMGAVLQSTAVAIAARSLTLNVGDFLEPMRAQLREFEDLLQDTSKFSGALDAIEHGLARGASCLEMSATLGTGIPVYEAVPMAIYCFMRHWDSYEKVIHEAIFIGGDTDTIACMVGAISGAFLGDKGVPENWLRAVREEQYSVAAIELMGDRLLAHYGGE